MDQLRRSFSDCLRSIALAGKIEYRPSDTNPARLSPLDLNKLSSDERLKLYVPGIVAL